VKGKGEGERKKERGKERERGEGSLENGEIEGREGKEERG
jgi:hypothetical protein